MIQILPPPLTPNPNPPHLPRPKKSDWRRLKQTRKSCFSCPQNLRAEVGKTYKESLSLTVLKKAEQVEKLAKSLKVEMNQEAAASKH